jgi:hypothetical protein
MFKWICLLVAIAALGGFGWMLNDMRVEVKALAEKADRLTGQAEVLLAKTDEHLPQIMAQTEKVTSQLDSHLPRILRTTEKASETINSQLPTLLTHSETAVDSITDLSDNFKQYKGLMGAVHAATKHEGLLSYGASILGFLDGSDATIGVKKPDGGLKHAMPAKAFAAAANGDVQFLSLVSRTKEDMLHGLARSKSLAALHVQVGDRSPQLLAAWLKESHPESKDVK